MVLVLNDVLNNRIESSDLIVLESNLNWCQDMHLSIQILLHLVEKWVLWIVLVVTQIR